MIVKKNWKSHVLYGDVIKIYKYKWTGYFLFGIIPIYLKRELI